MNQKIFNWALKDAKWYQFWLPQSGLIGGLIMGSFIFLIITLLS